MSVQSLRVLVNTEIRKDNVFHECTTSSLWINPMVCTVSYMPSEKEGLRQAVFKGVWEDILPIECRL